jgi:hypothetical protein
MRYFSGSSTCPVTLYSASSNSDNAATYRQTKFHLEIKKKKEKKRRRDLGHHLFAHEERGLDVVVLLLVKEL